MDQAAVAVHLPSAQTAQPQQVVMGALVLRPQFLVGLLLTQAAVVVARPTAAAQQELAVLVAVETQALAVETTQDQQAPLIQAAVAAARPITAQQVPAAAQAAPASSS
jgi:hypothetical protein